MIGRGRYDSANGLIDLLIGQVGKFAFGGQQKRPRQVSTFPVFGMLAQVTFPISGFVRVIGKYPLSKRLILNKFGQSQGASSILNK